MAQPSSHPGFPMIPDYNNIANTDTVSTTCSNCNECATCMIVRTLLARERGLREHLGDLQLQSNQERLIRANAQEQCRELQLSLNGSEHRCEALGAALDEARNCQLEMNKALVVERNKHAATHAEYSTLFSENQTLWRIFDEIAPVSAETGIPATIQELYDNNQEQERLIQNLKDEVRSLRGVEPSVGGQNNSCGYWRETTDIDDDDDQPEVLKADPAIKLLPSLLN
ncbi:hypothetical protein FQN50_003604 [Emmonsiellopsis sp. PD_5]|nr:hypothetical protein FQN50_003604 [Emmonsiellopsis sp. PD_5]